MYATTVVSHPFTKIATSATVLIIVSKTITQTGGNRSFLPNIFQSISIPLEFHGEGAALADNALHADLSV